MVRISIIIPTYNEEKYIATTLKSIKNQSFKDIEVIVADSNSSDRTRAIASATYPKVRFAVKKERGVGRACNAAVRVAKGNLILFIDADTSITKSLLPAYEKAFDDKEVVAATGPIVPLDKAPASMRIGYKLISVYLAKLLIKLGHPSIISSNLIVSKKAYQGVGGFDERMNTYYDWDLSNKLRRAGRIAFVNDAVAKTSTRRIKEWGMFKYFAFHTGNVIMYNLFHKPRQDYEPIR